MMDNQEDLQIETMIRFVNGIGIDVAFVSLKAETFLPGILIDRGKLLIDRSRLAHAGDIFHEAGHIALMTPEERLELAGNVGGQENADAMEMAVIAWSYAASLAAEIDPAVVLHDQGYQGGGSSILENFSQGRYFGVPLLEWLGMTDRRNETSQENQLTYPKMRNWLRGAL